MIRLAAKTTMLLLIDGEEATYLTLEKNWCSLNISGFIN